jgi:hypothetical protein
MVSLVAAFVAGGAGLYAGTAAQTLLVGDNTKIAASVGALWAVAWAGSKPIASLLDGWFASKAGLFPAGILLASPALAVAFGEIMLSAEQKQKIKAWKPPISWARCPELDFQAAELRQVSPESGCASQAARPAA